MRRRKQLHTTFYKGKRIRIVFVDGSQVVTEYLDTKKGKRMITAHGDFWLSDIKSIGIYKPLAWER